MAASDFFGLFVIISFYCFQAPSQITKIQHEPHSARLVPPGHDIMNPKARIEHRRMPTHVLLIEGLPPLV